MVQHGFPPFWSVPLTNQGNDTNMTPQAFLSQLLIAGAKMHRIGGDKLRDSLFDKLPGLWHCAFSAELAVEWRS
jgi:hypothetical protein